MNKSAAEVKVWIKCYVSPAVMWSEERRCESLNSRLRLQPAGWRVRVEIFDLWGISFVWCLWSWGLGTRTRTLCASTGASKQWREASDRRGNVFSLFTGFMNNGCSQRYVICLFVCLFAAFWSVYSVTWMYHFTEPSKESARTWGWFISRQIRECFPQRVTIRGVGWPQLFIYRTKGARRAWWKQWQVDWQLQLLSVCALFISAWQNLFSQEHWAHTGNWMTALVCKKYLSQKLEHRYLWEILVSWCNKLLHYPYYYTSTFNINFLT